MFEEGRINVTSPFPLDLDMEARIAAARLRITRAELVRRAVVEYLARLNPSHHKKTEAANDQA